MAPDPCRPVYMQTATNNLFGALIGAVSAQQRAADCAAQRKAQQDAYNAQQQQRAAALAQQRQAQQDQQAAQAARQAESDAARQAAEARQKKQAEAARAQRDKQASQARAKAQAAAAQEAAAQQQRAHEALQARWAAYTALVTAETAPDNQCRKPDTARVLLKTFSDFDNFKESNIKAIDIEHLTTRAYANATGALSCHGIFVTNRGLRLIGTLSIKTNIAGDPIASWTLDDSQDESLYTAPPHPEAVSVQTRMR